MANGMKELGDVAREEREEVVPAELARPLDASEMDALSRALEDKLGSAHDDARVPFARPKPRPRWQRVVAIAAPLAAAAAVVLTLRPRAAELPPYDLVVEGGQGTTRAEPVSAPRVRVERRGRLTLVLRPREPVSAHVGVVALVEAGDALTRWNVVAVTSSEGAVRIDASGEALRVLPDGESRLVVLVGEASRLPSDADDTRKAVAGDVAGVQSHAVRIDTH